MGPYITRAGREYAHASFNHVFKDSLFVSETFAIGSEMSGGVYNITIDNCIFGGPGMTHGGIHFKAPRQRGGSIHSIRVINSVFHLETSRGNDGHPAVSAEMFYGGSVPPGNQTTTPQVLYYIYIYYVLNTVPINNLILLICVRAAPAHTADMCACC
jgi:hypothetical protein